MDALEPAPIAFCYTAADFVAAQRLHATPSRRLRWSLAAIVTGLLGGLFWLTGDALALVLGVAAGVVAGAAFWFGIIPWAARRNFARTPEPALAFRLTLLPDGLRQSSARGTTMLRWHQFRKWRMSRQTTLLYTSSKHFLVVPARLESAGLARDTLTAALLREVGLPDR